MKARHTSNINEEEQRYLALGTQLNEMCSLEGRWREENSIVGDNSDLVTVDIGEALIKKNVE
jgi:hypothetical protein